MRARHGQDVALARPSPPGPGTARSPGRGRWRRRRRPPPARDVSPVCALRSARPRATGAAARRSASTALRHRVPHHRRPWASRTAAAAGSSRPAGCRGDGSASRGCARLDRYSASSTAVLPPPITATVLAAEEEAVAGGAGRDAEAAELLLARDAEPARLRAGGDDHRLGLVDVARIADGAERAGATGRPAVMMSWITVVPTCSAWACICSISQGPWMASAKPG